MNKKFLRFVAVLCVLWAIGSIMMFRSTFPEIGLPVLNLGNKEPEVITTIGSPYKFYFAELTSNEKFCYNKILEEIYDMPEKIQIPYVSETELDNVFSALLYDNPDLIFMGRKCTVSDELWCHFFSADYIMTKDEYAEKKREMDEQADRIVASLTDVTNQWKTELEIHDWVVDHCSYKLEDGDHIYSSAYGALVNRKAACEGYSRALKLLFDKVGIESTLVSGTAGETEDKMGLHMWNIVRINGDFYHVDATWDDPVNNSNRDIKLHTYFNVSDNVIKKNHRDFSIDIPCTKEQ